MHFLPFSLLLCARQPDRRQALLPSDFWLDRSIGAPLGDQKVGGGRSQDVYALFSAAWLAQSRGQLLSLYRGQGFQQVALSTPFRLQVPSCPLGYCTGLY